MALPPSISPTETEHYLLAQRQKRLLRFITCGSVDDGKSTLIGRLLYESKLVFDDHLAALERDSVRFGTQRGDLDFALLLDGLLAEREQGITIDVAHRFFASERRKFIVADTPGHEQYTRNMVTGASTADAAVILIDARNGVLTQTRRHSHVLSLIGVRHIVIAINKMDLVDYDEPTFRSIEKDYVEFAGGIGMMDVTAIPISALKGDNVLTHSERMPWYHGPTLMGYLDTVELDEDRLQRQPFRMPVQWINRPNLDFRGITGMIAGGSIAPGDRIRVQPSGIETTVARIVTHDGDLERAVAGQSITLTLADDIDVSRGDLISAADNPAEVADQFVARLVWMSDQPLLAERGYLFKIGSGTVPGTVTRIKYTVNVNTLEHTAATELELNGIGICNIALDRAIPFDPYTENPNTGGFIVIDKLTNVTSGAGMLEFALRRAHNIHRQHVDIDKSTRMAMTGQKAAVIWFTGLSGAGKSTIANLVERKLHRLGHWTYLLDGDNVRHGLNKDLGFTDADRVENIRRVAEVAKLMVDAGLVVLVSFISPFRSERRFARALLEPGEFVEVFVNTPLAVAEQRDRKGLYQKARRGELTGFTGIDSPYEPPTSPEIELRTTDCTAEEAADQVIANLQRLNLLRG
ncbi:MAG TPA: sulfate adenylyltransferase subunit CysN [Solirubrobacteraceae bacterium]|nr:sulfate adenylyltransferase subunit CysN [Solirubrobacteraceae bacterium]